MKGVLYTPRRLAVSISSLYC